MFSATHDPPSPFFGGPGRRGIYDNTHAAVDAISAGRQRGLNRRFLQLCSHHLVEPTACTPNAAWEKGQVENQVRTARGRFFTPVPRFEGLAELNARPAPQRRPLRRYRASYPLRGWVPIARRSW